MSGVKRARLGKGLGALLGDEFITTAGGADSRTLAVEKILPNPFQPRREFREQELGELSRSIKENGLLQPLVVRPAPAPVVDRYQLVAGERRLRAVTALGWTQVPAVVREMDDRTLLVLALVENIQREELNPLEEAEGFQLLADEFGLTHGEIAEAVGKNRSTVANTLRLLRLPPSIRKLLLDGTLSMGHARALLAVEDPGRLVELGRRAAREGWSVREVEARVRSEAAPGGRVRPPGTARSSKVAREDPVVQVLQEALQEALGARVRLREGRNGDGVIEVPFSSADDFERVFELITGRDVADIAG